MMFRIPRRVVRPLSLLRRYPSAAATKEIDDIASSAQAVNFGDAESVYRAHSTSEIFKAILVLRLCKVQALVDNSEFLLRTLRMTVGIRQI